MPFTKAVPKELVPAYDRPVIHYAVREAMAAGIERIAIVTARGKEALQQYFQPEPRIEQMMYDKGLGAIADELRSFRNTLRFSYPIQEEQLGLGHAVLCGKGGCGPGAIRRHSSGRPCDPCAARTRPDDESVVCQSWKLYRRRRSAT